MTNESPPQYGTDITRQGRYVPGYSPATLQHHATRTAAHQAAFFLHHLDQPVTALKEMRRVLKRGGVIGIRNTDIDGRIIGPAQHGLAEYYALYDRISQHHGSDHRSGRHLRGLLRQAGFVRIEASASYDCYGTPEETRELAQSQIARIKSTPAFDEAVAAGWIDRVALNQIVAAWEKWGEDPDAFCADARCEVVGAGKNNRLGLRVQVYDCKSSELGGCE